MKTKWMKIYKIYQWFSEKKAILGIVMRIIAIVIIIIVLANCAYKIWQDDIKHWDERATMVIQVGTSSVEETSPVLSNTERSYGPSIFKVVTENDRFALNANFATGEIYIKEKATGKKWYSNPLNRDEDTSLSIKSRLSSQLILKCLNVDKVTTLMKDNFADSIQLGGMEYEYLDNGIKFIFTFPDVGIRVPVQYCLTEDGFTAEILSDKIEELWSEKYVLLDVSFLPFFGASGIEDEGYLFIPDGSGALIEFNNNKQKYPEYSQAVYGLDSTLKDSNAIGKQESVLMPIYGMKCNENGFLAVIYSGESNATINASTSRKSSSYNTIYSTATYRVFSNTEIDGHAISKGAVPGLDYSEKLLEGANYSIQYIFLEKDADYSEMSQKYREYLEERKLLKNSKLADENYLVLDIYGAVSIEKNILGVKVPVLTALTTYNQVCQIVKELKSEGVENIIINYIGALKGGFESQIWNEIKYEKCLGSESDFQDMISYLQQEEVLLFFESNSICIYENQSNYNGKKDGVKTLFDKYLFNYNYTLNTNEPTVEDRWYLLRPKLVADQMVNFAKAADEEGLSNVSFYGVGDTLYSDLIKGENLTGRPESVKMWKDAMEDISERVDYMMVHGGNNYCLPYVDIVTDAPSYSSEYDIVDQTIPFYYLVMNGNIAISEKAINNSANYNLAFLKSVENGSCLKFNVIYSGMTDIVGTKYNYMGPFSYTQWKDIMVEQYLEKQEIIEKLAGQKFVHHEQIDNDVYMSMFESGTVVIVNYSDDSYDYGNVTIDANGYMLIEGHREEEND